MGDARSPGGTEGHLRTLPAWLAPVVVPDLVRVGGAADGGYVVPRSLLGESDLLISMGLGDNWQFEIQYSQLNPLARIDVYDHTRSAQHFAWEFLKEFGYVATFQTHPRMIGRRWRRLWSYLQFFKKRTRRIHYRERVQKMIEPDDRIFGSSVEHVFRRATPARTFVKMDIEGSEYEVLEETLQHHDRVIGLAIEFHDVTARRTEFERLMQLALERYVIVHLHGNNFRPVGPDGLPDAVEVTLGRNDWITGTERREQLPLALDRPNDPSRPDFRLQFV